MYFLIKLVYEVHLFSKIIESFLNLFLIRLFTYIVFFIFISNVKTFYCYFIVSYLNKLTHYLNFSNQNHCNSVYSLVIKNFI